MARIDVTMPKMGESITEGTVIVWHKKPGDPIELDEALLEIGTDKVDTEVPSPSAGTLFEIRVPEGETVEVGTVIAVIESDVTVAAAPAPPVAPAPPAASAPVVAPAPSAASAPAAAAPAGGVPAAGAPAGGAQAAPASAAAAPATPISVAPAAAPVAVASAAAPAAPQAGGQRVDVVMPKMGESIMEGTVLSWKKQPGDAIELDEPLLEIATDKVDTEVPSPAAGIVGEILVEEGATVEVGTLIAVIFAGTGAGVTAVPAPSAAPAAASAVSAHPAAPAAAASALATTPAASTTPSAPVLQPASTSQPAAIDAGPVARTGSEGSFYSPLVRAIAEKEGISAFELSAIPGSGTSGRVTKKDVLTYLERRSAAMAASPVPGTAARPAAPSALPAAGAPVLTPSALPAGAKPVTTTPDGRTEIVEMDRMRQIIAEHMVRSKATSAHVTSFAEIDVTNLVRLREARKDEFQRREGVKLTYTPFFVHAAVEALKNHPILNASVEEKRILIRKDIHIGIAVAIGADKLMVPVIRNAGQKNVAGLAHAANDLATRARSKQLQPDDIMGGTFTVTNVGSLGSIMGTPIINQPQVAILATGAIKKRPVVLEDPVLGDVIAIRQMMYVSLSYDHRIIDGAMAASFLQRYIQLVETYSVDFEL